MAERLPIGKRMVALGTVFSLLHHVLPRRPLSPVCALGTSPKRGSASRGKEILVFALAPPLGELSSDSETERAAGSKLGTHPIPVPPSPPAGYFPLKVEAKKA